ncbi:FxLYD domain-containing protein [Halopiger goleimassiliensis]|uniref:FxLYD domain-containing protein n=1 Tax=Halopiger goleimassiliensis TaxID=1293048 RepID=UPI000677723D|nr:FxLYD domain-containing protein [Halopiger goleimassiliensis]
MTRSASTSRRRLLAALGTGIAGAAAGCTGEGGFGGEPSYEEGNVGDVTATNASNRSASEMSAATALAQQEPNNSVTPLETLSLVDHEFVVESGYLGSTIQGTVQNTGSDRIQIAEVRTRIYNESGNLIGRYFASTGDFEGGDAWEFQVVVLESPSDVAEYDITVLGTPS